MVYVSTSCLKGDKSRFEPDVITVVNKYINLGIKKMELGAAHRPFNDFSLLKKLKKQNDLDFIFHGNFPASNEKRYLNIASIDEDFRKRCIKIFFDSLEKLNYLEGNFLSLHPGGIADYLLDDTTTLNLSDIRSATQRAIESLQLIVDRAKENGIKIAIENLPGTITKDIVNLPSEFMFIKKQADVGLLLDLGHLDTYIISENKKGRGLVRKQLIKEFEPYIYEIHCHKAIMRDEHLMPEKNQFSDLKRKTLIKARLTLEINNADEKMVLEGKQLLESLKPVTL